MFHILSIIWIWDFLNIGQVVAADKSSRLGKDFFLYSTNINLKNRDVAFADERQR